MPKNIRAILGMKPTEGQMGIEIEVEGKNLPGFLNDSIWRVDKDGSLKGESYEYVTPLPVSLEGVKAALDYLKEAYKANKTVVYESVRAGVHVHQNVQNLTLKQLFTFIISYYVLEDVLVEWCGENRVGNHFCLRTRDAEYVLFKLLDAVEKRKLGGLKTDNIRYSSLNVCSLFKYGSIEFRAMRGTGNLDDIYTWASVINDIYNASLKFSDPLEVVLSVCNIGESTLLKKLLPNTFKNFIGIRDYEHMIREGARRVQMVAFAQDWAQFDRPSKNPFTEEEEILGKLATTLDLNDWSDTAPSPEEEEPDEDGF